MHAALARVGAWPSRNWRIAVVTIGVLLAMPMAGWAQSPAADLSSDPASEVTPDFLLRSAATRVPPTSKSNPGVRAYGFTEFENLKASESFTAVLGTARLNFFGGGADAVNLWKGLFARFTFSHSSKTGTRVFVDSSQNVFPLNIPLTVSMTPFEVGGGWRFGSLDTKGRIVPFIGAGLVFLNYKESSSFSLNGEDTDQTFSGTMIFGGIEVGIVQHVNVAVEGLYRHVPDAIGEAGISNLFDENNLGGSVIRFRFGVGF